MLDVPAPPIPFQAEFIDWWKAVPREEAGALVPTLSACLDHADSRLAPWCLIVDVEAEHRLPIRLFGTKLAEIFGEITGANYLDYMPTKLRPEIGQSHRLICDQPCGRYTHASTVSTGGREVVLGMVSLPVSLRGRIGHVLKLTRVLDTLDRRDGIAGVRHVFRQDWIDLGAGVPAVTTLAWE
jgi:hypothetical protein